MKQLHEYRTGYLKLRSVLHDRNTGLPAYPILFDDLRTLLDRRRELGVLHFEIVNLDTVESIYGWQVFDRIVARAAGTIRGCLGEELPPESLIAVNGVAGDSLVVFVPDGPGNVEPAPTYLGGVGEAVCRRLQAEFEDDDFSGLSPRLWFRSGHALLAENPFFRFERCVYAAVEEARALHAVRERRRELSWGEELQRIISEGRVSVVFQPVLELETGGLLGHEAFVRGPDGSIFESPRSMFALSDRMGLSEELDRVCCEAAVPRFSELACGGKLFLNVLPTSLRDDRWRQERLPALLRSCSLERRDIVLEISERCAENDPGPFVVALRGFKEEGFGLALDDVGTGRAGVAAVETLRPDYLKLDVSLVRNIHENLVQQDVLAGLVRLAADIDAGLIAEGVEAQAEATTLAQAGARYAQGFLFAPPEARPQTREGWA